MDARGNEEFARAFRRRLVEHRRLDVDEALGIEIAARGDGRAVAKLKVLLHLRAAQVDHAVLQADRFRQILVVELERRRLRDIEDLDLVREDFDLAAREVRIHGAFGAWPHETRHADDEFVAQLFRDGEGRRAIGIADDLHQTFAIAQIDENDAAVIAAPMHPAADGDRLGQELAVDAPAVVGAFQVFLRRIIQGPKQRIRGQEGAVARRHACGRRGAVTRSISGSGGCRDGDLWGSADVTQLRRDDTHRDDVLQCLVHGHVELVDARFRQHQKEP